jgi:hypothetical protein
MPLMLPKPKAVMTAVMVHSDLGNAYEDCPSKSQDDYKDQDHFQTHL